MMASSTKGAITLASFNVMPIDSIERCAELEGRNQEETRRSIERHDSSRVTIAASVIIMARILHLIAGQVGACGGVDCGEGSCGRPYTTSAVDATISLVRTQLRATFSDDIMALYFSVSAHVE